MLAVDEGLWWFVTGAGVLVQPFSLWLSQLSFFRLDHCAAQSEDVNDERKVVRGSNEAQCGTSMLFDLVFLIF